MSNRYSTDKGMQNLFESFRRSLNEAPNVARNALVDDEGARHYADEGMPTSDDVAQVIAQALQDPKMQSRLEQGAEGDIASMIVQLFPIDSMDYSQAMRDGSGISASAGQPYDKDGSKAAGQAETMMAKANEAIEGARYHQLLSDLGMDASIEQIIDLAKGILEDTATQKMGVTPKFGGKYKGVALSEGRMKYLEGEIVNGLMEMMQQYDVTIEDIKGVIDSGAVQNVMDMLSDKNRPPREPMTPDEKARMYTKTI